MAAKFGVKVHVRSTFTDRKGTMVVPETYVDEKLMVSGVAYNKNEVSIKVRDVPDQPGVAMKLFIPISQTGIVADAIIHNTSADGPPVLPSHRAQDRLQPHHGAGKGPGRQDRGQGGQGRYQNRQGLHHRHRHAQPAGVATKMFTTLAREDINIQMINISEIKISCIIDEKYTELAERALHDAFGLTEEAAPAAEDVA